jgi:hypothetical protein
VNISLTAIVCNDAIWWFNLQLIRSKPENVSSALSVRAIVADYLTVFDAPSSRVVGNATARVLESADISMIGSICDMISQISHMIYGVESPLVPFAQYD